MTIGHFNALDEGAARKALMHCCTSHRWVAAMLAARPYASDAALRDRARTAWQDLGEDDWLEAFAGHPRIGDLPALQQRFGRSSRLAAAEQAGVSIASDSILERLAAGNAAYEARFGFLFIVRASGRSALEMCELLETRLNNDRDEELRVAAAEQLEILLIRVEQLL
jgi:2-oxo-4-hydroxy-4-carboxy-5-ureidoimidazoline decarboxylase